MGLQCLGMKEASMNLVLAVMSCVVLSEKCCVVYINIPINIPNVIEINILLYTHKSTELTYRP